MTQLSPARPAHPRPSSARAWVMAARPKTLPTAVAPVVVGTGIALSLSGASPAPAGAALVGALALQIGCNFVNDAADHARGADGDDRLGAPRAAQLGLLSGAQLWRGAGVAFAVAAACGIALTAIAGWPIVAIGLSAIAAAIGYTAGRKPLGYLGLGDALVFTFYGPVAVGGTALVQLGHVPPSAIWAALPVGALAAAVLAVNNLRDRHQDVRVGKRTLAVRLGGRATRAQYLILAGTAFATPIAVALATGQLGWLLPLATAPLALAPVRTVLTRDGAALEPALGGTARWLAAYSLALAIGVTL